MDYKEVIQALYAGKYLRVKSWPADQYIRYWNHVVILSTGGVFDLINNLALVDENHWEIYGTIEEVLFKDLKYGDKFVFYKTGEVCMKVRNDVNTPGYMALKDFKCFVQNNQSQKVIKV